MSSSEVTQTPATPTPLFTLPPGVTVGPGRETAQLNNANQLVQGQVFAVVLPSGASTSVFVPYSVLDNTPQLVEGLFLTRINAIQSIPGQG